jgi:hypothetical protein
MPTTHDTCLPRVATVTLGSSVFAQGYLLRLIDDSHAVISVGESEIVGRLIKSSLASGKPD